MSDVFDQRTILALKMRDDVLSLYQTLNKLNIDKFNKKSLFYWSDHHSISVNRRFPRNNIVLVQDIKELDCFIEIIQNEDDKIFEAISEASNWIQSEIVLLEEKVEDFSLRYCEAKKNVDETLLAYEMMK